MFGDPNTSRPVRKVDPDVVVTWFFAICFLLFVGVCIMNLGWETIPVVLLVLWALSPG